MGSNAVDGALMGPADGAMQETISARDQPDDPPALAVIASREGSPVLSPHDCDSLGFRAPRKCVRSVLESLI